MLLTLSLGTAGGQVGDTDLFPLAYDLDVSLDPETRALVGTEVIQWENRSDVSVDRLPLHLYLNAFSHDQTTWMRTAHRRGMDDVFSRYDDVWGWTNLTRVERDGQLLQVVPIAPNDSNPYDRTLVEVPLDPPVGPGEKLTLEIDFEARLPIPLARTGGYEDYFLVAQWFPKPAVLELPGTRGARTARWEARQFHGPTEFYADYGRFDVTIEVPEGFVVAATGTGGPSGDQSGRYTFTADRVHDFAFVVTRAHATFEATIELPRGESVSLTYLLPHGTEHQLPRWRQAIEGAMTVMSKRIAAWPYPTMTVVLPTMRGHRTSGMEYPTFLTGLVGDPIWDVMPGIKLNELVLIHEFAHQYFYGIVGSNEQMDAFLDEGFTSYWEGEIMSELYGNPAGGRFMSRALDTHLMRTRGLRGWRHEIVEGIRQQPSYMFAEGTWGGQIYTRPALTLETAARLFGRSKLDAVFAAYVQQFRFRHPGPDDFLRTARSVGGDAMADFLEEALQQPNIPDYRVVEISSKTWSPPDGQWPSEGVMAIDTEAEWQLFSRSPVVSRRTTPSDVVLDAPDASGPGRTEVVDLEVYVESLLPADDARFVSECRVASSGWRHLPVDIEFEFADGLIARDSWNGRSAWRHYRFARSAPLAICRIDPDESIALDVTPANDSVAIRADRTLVADWSFWTAMLTQWMTSGFALWL